MDQTGLQRKRKCSCGWTKVTTYLGLRIHQRKVKTPRRKLALQQQIRQGGTVSWSSTNGYESSATNSAASTLVTPQVMSPEEPQPRYLDGKSRSRLKASEKDECWILDESLHTSLQNALKGNTIAKLNIFGDFIYEEAKRGFGELQQRKSLPKQCGRLEREIHQLVKERRLLWKAWKRSEDHEKEGLKKLWDHIRVKLGLLRRAEREVQLESKVKLLPWPFKSMWVAVGKENRDSAHHWTGDGGPYNNPDKLQTSGAPLVHLATLLNHLSHHQSSIPPLQNGRISIKWWLEQELPGPNGVSYKVYKGCLIKIRRNSYKYFKWSV